MPWFAYALWSQKDGGLYIGMTSDVARRLKEHNGGYNRSTRSRVPFELIHVREFQSRKQAREHEKYLKTGKGREALRQIRPVLRWTSRPTCRRQVSRSKHLARYVEYPVSLVW